MRVYKFVRFMKHYSEILHRVTDRIFYVILRSKSYVGLRYRKIYEILQSKSYIGLRYRKFYEILR